MDLSQTPDLPHRVRFDEERDQPVDDSVHNIADDSPHQQSSETRSYIKDWSAQTTAANDRRELVSETVNHPSSMLETLHNNAEADRPTISNINTNPSMNQSDTLAIRDVGSDKSDHHRNEEGNNSFDVEDHGITSQDAWNLHHVFGNFSKTAYGHNESKPSSDDDSIGEGENSTFDRGKLQGSPLPRHERLFAVSTPGEGSAGIDSFAPPVVDSGQEKRGKNTFRSKINRAGIDKHGCLKAPQRLKKSVSRGNLTIIKHVSRKATDLDYQTRY